MPAAAALPPCEELPEVQETHWHVQSCSDTLNSKHKPLKRCQGGCGQQSRGAPLPRLESARAAVVQGPIIQVRGALLLDLDDHVRLVVRYESALHRDHLRRTEAAATQPDALASSAPGQ